MVLTKWTPKMTKKFISIYKEHECLWKVDDPQYRDKDARDDALNHMWRRMNLPGLEVKDVKKKIKYLRATYMVEVNKIENSPGKKYKPCLTWFYEMDSFVRAQIRKSGGNRWVVKTDLHSGRPCEDVPEDSESEQSLEIGGASNRHQDSPEESHQLYNEEEVYLPSDSNQDPFGLITERARRKRRSQLSNILNPEPLPEHRSPAIRNCQIRDSQFKEEDEFDVYGRHVAIQLRHLTEQDVVMAQEEIQKVLTRYRLNKIRRKVRGDDSVDLKSVPTVFYETIVE